MRVTGKLAALGILLPTLLSLARPCAAAPSNKQEFLTEKEEIIALACERARTPTSDYQKLLKTAEDRLRSLHENYQLRRSTPPTNLEGDVQQLVGATQRIRLQRSRGADVPSDAGVHTLITRIWDDYAAAVEGIFQEIQTAKRSGGSESQAYWEVVSRFSQLCDETARRAVFNPPPDVDSTDSVFRQDELRLLRALEFSPRKTQGADLRVELAVPEQASGQLDIAPFYASQGVLPEKSPREIAVLNIPAGSRTVTRRRSGENMIIRTIEGRGVVYIGASEKVLDFGYIMIPADTSYYFENTGSAPLVLEYIALRVS